MHLNSISPHTQVEMKFMSVTEDPTNRSDLSFNSFALNAEKRHKHIKYFLAVCDPITPPPTRSIHPNRKVQVMLKHTLCILKEAIIMGKYVSANKYTMSYKGCHPVIPCINYKREGDEFQCDALCSDGYTYSFYFRNQPAPKHE